MSETIFALSSPPGKGGIAVIRVSGPGALQSLCAVCDRADFQPRRAIYATLRDPRDRSIIDRAVALYYKGPHSFTGEDTAEYLLHGGIAVTGHMLGVLERQPGHRLARPGEFTRRAFENGKLDLTEAEAVADLIDAQTILQKTQALSQLEGGLSSLYEGWTQSLKTVLAHLEADLEFPDEDLPDGILPDLLPQIEALARDIAAHLDDNRRGERLRDGIRIAVIGAPNAGKSSLVNALAQREVAIVSPHAGTTRDVIEAHLDIGGYPVILSDTAGLRPEQLGDSAQDEIEGEGIRRALAAAGRADIKMLVFDATSLPSIDAHTSALLDESAVAVFNKCDLYKGAFPDFPSVRVSVKTGYGIESLVEMMARRVDSQYGRREVPSLTRRRHRAALEQALESLRRIASAPLPELAAEDVRLATRFLGSITGKVDVEDVLDVIFRDFCIGK